MGNTQLAGELPFLVEHGAMVWKVLLLALVGGTATIYIAIRNWRARRKARTATVEYLRDAGPPEAGHSCVRGVLRDGSLYTLSNGSSSRDHLEGAPWLECPDGVRMHIARAGCVVSGTRVTKSTLRIPDGTPEELAGVRGAWVLSSVHDGDELVVRGIATRGQADVAGYRDDTTSWVLEDNIRICAVKPTARARPRHVLAQLSLLLVVAVLWHGALRKVGSAAASRLERRPALGDLPEIPPLGDLSIACAMPDSCGAGRDREIHWYFERYGNRGSAFPQFDALMRSDPCRLAHKQMRQVRLHAALASARACGDRAHEAWIQLFLGNYRAALDLAPARAVVREYAAVGVGDWKVAAEAAEASASRTKESFEDAHYFARGNAEARCRAAWYRHLAGAADSFTNVEVKTAGCRLLAALARPAHEQPELVRAVVEGERRLDIKDQDRSAWSRGTAILALLGGRDDRADIDIAFGVDADFWLTTFEAPSSAAFEGRAGIAVLSGDFAAARAAADAMTSERRKNTARDWIALREGTQPGARDYIHPALEEVLALRSAAMPEAVHWGIYPEECAPRLVRGIEAALAGDARLLASVFADCHVFYNTMPELLLGILPHVQHGRAELADSLRAFRSDLTTFTLDHVPFQLVRDLAEARDLARLVGDVEEANRLQTIIEPHARLLRDRTRALAMFMLSS